MTPIWDGAKFLGYENRECGDHRTTGGRAWCFDCGEWCTPGCPCVRCERPHLIALLRQAGVEYE